MKNPIKYNIYDADKTYEENYDHGPFFTGKMPVRPDIKTKIKLWDFELNSPLGIPAGPLLNSNWVKFYAEMGFDIPVYKTVRSVTRACHPAPNCVYVNPPQIALGSLPEVTTTTKPNHIEDLTITNSFGVPAKEPAVWMADIAKGNKAMGPGQVMIVSVTGTPEAEGRELYDDFAYTAGMAKEAGAQIIETNYSCPNVSSAEGSIYADPEASSAISKRIRASIGGDIPFIIKIGNLPYDQLKAVVKANLPYVDGIAGINTMPGLVRNAEGAQALPGKGRLKSGICGQAIHDISQNFVENMTQIKKELGGDFIICGVGGIMSVSDFDERLNAGADIVMSATATMWDPFLAQRWHESR